ncbi:TIR domain-containing protein [candidate division KSB1 bacterium]|nr:TIR domain-containing protein [candidate division KSB1 bacterium]
MPKVFISHSWEDNEVSRKLADNLRRDGAEVWIDTSRISGGDSLPDAIGEGIEWCDVFLLVWSKSAKNSYYVTLERNCALDNRKRIIPCIIDYEKVPTIFSAFLRIDFKNFEQGYSSLARDLKLTNIEKEPKVIPAKKAVPKPKIIKPKITIFRSNPKELSDDDVMSMLKKFDFFSKEYDWNKGYCNPTGKGFMNDFVLQKDGQLVYDRNSGLMWQQGGSIKEMNYEVANQWIVELNRIGFAGFNDWRLPTLEEAMSLMETEVKKEDLYIDSIFDGHQRWLSMADLYKGKLAAWSINFYVGNCKYYPLDYGSYVRAVRSVESPQE